MKLGYFGSPEISRVLLQALVESDRHEVAFVVANPDKPRGRSGRPVPAETAAFALEREIPVHRFVSLREPDESGADPGELLAAHGAELYVVFAYGRLLPEAVYNRAPRGAINLHASLLPALRGASPIQTAVLEGFAETGWTVQFLAPEMDAGDVLATRSLAVEPDESAGELAARMLPSGVALMLDALDDFDRLASQARPQDHARATFCKKIRTEDAFIDWRQSALRIHNQVRGMNPAPVARTPVYGADGSGGGLLKILRTRLVEDAEGESPANGPDATGSGSRGENDAPGTGRIVQGPGGKALRVICGSGAVDLLEVQPENRRAQGVRDFLNGLRLPTPLRLGADSETPDAD